jgi:Malate:quinone oxidoreductase (Mqo)
MSDTSSSGPDVVLIGAGIMSATLGVFLKELEPSLNIEMFETLEGAGLESSDSSNHRSASKWTRTALFRKHNWAAAEMTLEERSDLILAFARFCTPTANPPTRR